MKNLRKVINGYCSNCGKLYIKEYMRAYRLRDEDYYKKRYFEVLKQRNHLITTIKDYNEEIRRVKIAIRNTSEFAYEKLKFAQIILGMILHEIDIEEIE